MPNKWMLILMLLLGSISLPAARKALVIGNANYEVAALSNPVNDARAVEKLLRELGFVTTLRLNQNRRDLEESIDSFTASLKREDEAIFYYSGHGAQVEGENYLIPVGKVMKDEKDIKYDGVNANKATAKLSNAGVSIVVLDACRDNPFRGVKGGSNKGLAVMSLDKGRQYIIYSTASGQTAADGGSAGLSPFTDAFVRHAGTPGLTIDQMMHMVNADVRQSTDGKQIPFTYHSMDQPYYLARADDSVPLSTTSGKPVYTPPSAQHDMVYVEGGSFMMGSNGYYDDETPVHKVTVSSFWIGKYEVTQAEWKEVMGSNPSYWKGDRLPVEKVSWYAAIKYCNLRSLAEGLTPCYSISGITSPSNWGPVPTENRNSTWDAVVCDFNANGYRLPTEAEWEYAARGGVRSIGYDYSGSNNLGSVAWYTDNSDSKTHAVGTKDPNELGIYDMSGNVWEWCWDWKANYSSSPQDNPTGPNKGSYRLLRGGSWYGSATYCRVAYRDYDNPYVGYFYYVGFRLCRTAK